MVKRARNLDLVGKDVGSRGFLLADALVAAVLLGVSLAVMVGLVSRAARTQREGQKLEVVAMLLDEQLNLVLARGADDYSSRFGLEGACDAPYQEYRYKLAITGGSGDAFVVKATILWDSRGQERSETVETRIAPRLGDEPDPARRPSTSVVRP